MRYVKKYLFQQKRYGIKEQLDFTQKNLKCWKLNLVKWL